MKKNIIFVTVAVAALLLSFSCTKQDETPAKTFKAVIERELTKTTVGDFDYEKGEYPLAWSYGDLVMINDAVYSAVPDKEKPQEAELEFVDGTIPEAPYTAVFPASLYNSENDRNEFPYEFPRVQKYEEGKLNAPMAAKGKEEKLSFRNLCAVICFELKGEGVVKQIQITSNFATLHGPFTVNEDGFFTGMKEPTCEFDYITLDCKDGVTLNKVTPEKFYVYLPSASYPAGSLDIRFFDFQNNWTHYELTSSEDLSLDYGNLYNFPVENVKFTNKPEYDPHYDNR